MKNVRITPIRAGFGTVEAVNLLNGYVSTKLRKVASLQEASRLLYDCAILTQAEKLRFTVGTRVDESGNLFQIDFMYLSQIAFSVQTTLTHNQIIQSAQTGTGDFLRLTKQLATEFNQVAAERQPKESRNDIVFDTWYVAENDIELNFTGGQVGNYNIVIREGDNEFSIDKAVARFRAFYNNEPLDEPEPTPQYVGPIHFGQFSYNSTTYYSSCGHYYANNLAFSFSTGYALEWHKKDDFNTVYVGWFPTLEAVTRQVNQWALDGIIPSAASEQDDQERKEKFISELIKMLFNGKSYSIFI